MTWTAETVTALVCARCDADLRGQVKVQQGERWLCATCALAEEWRRDHGPVTEPTDTSS